MDRYDRIIRDIQQKTDSELIRWKVVSSDQHSGILLNAFQIVRTLAAEYPIGKRKYDLLFVERKVDFHDEFGDSTEGYGCELLVLDEDGQMVLSLYEGVVDRDDLLKLAGLIDEHNDRVKNFFEAFDESGAA
jgi:hypothetical protein